MKTLRYGYCAVGDTTLGLDSEEGNRKEGSKALSKLNIEKVEYQSLISQSEDCIGAAQFFHDNKVDALIINFAGFLAGGNVLRFAAELENIPLILWSFGTGPTLPLTCLMEATSDLTKTGKHFSLVIGTPDNAKTIQEIKVFLKAIDACGYIRKVNIGFIGYACPGMVDVAVDEISLRRKIGCELTHLDLIELVEEYKAISDKAVKPVVGELKTSVGEVLVDEKALIDSSKMYLALQNMVKKYKLDAFTIRCWPELRGDAPFWHVSPCYALSRFNEEGIIGACESDVSSAVLMLLMRRLSGKPAISLDYTTLNPERNSLGFWHCGPHAMSLAESKKDISARVPPLGGKVEWGGSCAIEFSIKQGKATFAKLTREYDKMSIVTGQFVKPNPVFRGGIGEATLDVPVRDYMNKVIELGFEHHICAIHDDVTNDLLKICKLLDIEPVILD